MKDLQPLYSLDVLGYRRLKNFQLNDLAPVNLLVGANNVGKSSILEAAALLLRPTDTDTWLAAGRQREVDPILVASLETMFADGLISVNEKNGERIVANPITVSGETSDGHHAIEASCNLNSGSPGHDGFGPFATVFVRVDNKTMVVIKIPNTTPVPEVSWAFRVTTITPTTRLHRHTTVELVSHAVTTQQKTLAVEVLQLFDPDVTDIDVVTFGEQSSVKITHKVRGVVDLASFGDGMRQACTLALGLVRASQGVLLVDEIEAGIHHSALVKVFSALITAAKRTQTQIIATTHSLETVDALLTAAEGLTTDDPDEERIAAYHLRVPTELDRQDGYTGFPMVRRYGQKKLHLLREGGLDIR